MKKQSDENNYLDDFQKEIKRAFTTERTVCEHGVTVSLFQCPSCELNLLRSELAEKNKVLEWYSKWTPGAIEDFGDRAQVVLTKYAREEKK